MLFTIRYISTKTFKERSVNVNAVSRDSVLKVARFIHRDLYEPLQIIENS